MSLLLRTRSRGFAIASPVGIVTRPGILTVPIINGTPTVGVPSGYTAGTYSGSGIMTITRQWTIGAPGSTSGADILNATGSTYTPVVGDIGKVLRVVETASNSAGNSGANQSASVAVVAAPALTTTATLYRALAVMDISNRATNDRPDYETAHPTVEGSIINHGWQGTHAPNNFSNAVQEFVPTSPTTGFNRTAVVWEQYTNATDHIPKIPPRGETSLGDIGPGPTQGGFNKSATTYDNHPSAYFDKTRDSAWLAHGIANVGVSGNLGQYIRGFLYPQTHDPTDYILADTEYHFGEVYNPTVVSCPDLNWVISYGASNGSGYPSFSMRIFKYTGNPSAPWSCLGSTIGMQPHGLPSFAQTRNEACCLGTTMYLGGGVNKWDGVHPAGGPGFGIAPYESGSVSNVIGWYDHGMLDGQELPATSLFAAHGIPDLATVYARDCTTHTFKICATPGGAALTIPDGSGLFWYPNPRLYAIDLTTTIPTVTIVSQRYANQTAQANGKQGKLVADTLRNRLIHIGKKVTAFDIATSTWTEISVAGWPAGGFDRVQGFFSAEFDAVYFRGNDLPLEGTPAYQADTAFPGANQWEWHSIVFPPYRAQVGNAPRGEGQDVYIDGAHKFTWDNVGGDFKNALGVAQSTASPYGTVSVVNICAPGGAHASEDLSINVTSMLDEMFIDNTFIYLRAIGGDRDTRFALDAHATENGARLVITKTDTTTVELPLLFDCVMSAPFFADQWGGSAIAKFDLSSLTRAQCSSASLIIRHIFDWFAGNAITVGAFLGNPPYIKDIPQQLRAETVGSADPAIKIWCNGDAAGKIGFSDADTIVADSTADAWWPPTQVNTWNGDAVTNPPYLYIPDGRGGLRIKQPIGVHGGASARRYFVPNAVFDGNWDEAHPQIIDFYLTYTIKIPFDAGDINPGAGEKLCGFESWGDTTNPDSLSGFNSRFEHGEYSAANQWQLRFLSYYYDPAIIIAGGGSNGSALDLDQPGHFLMRRGRTYTMSMRLRENTFTSGVPNPDGLYEVYCNWVYMPNGSLHNHITRTDPRQGLNDFFLQIYCGGTGVPSKDTYYTVSNILVTTELPARNNPLLRYIRQNS